MTKNLGDEFIDHELSLENINYEDFDISDTLEFGENEMNKNYEFILQKSKLHDDKKKSIEVAIQEALQKNGIELHDKSLINQAVLLLFKEECTLPRYASSSKEMVDAETQLKDQLF